jgi:hypothetical protein
MHIHFANQQEVHSDAVTFANTTGMFEKLKARTAVLKKLSALGLMGASGIDNDIERNFSTTGVGALSEVLHRTGTRLPAPGCRARAHALGG